MTPKDRVLKALEHKIPDRVPLFEIWIDDEIAAKLGAENLQAAHYNLGLDCMMIPYSIPLESNSWRTGTDEFGIVWQDGQFKAGILKTEKDLKRYSPSLDRVKNYFNAQEIEKAKKAYPDHCFIFGIHIGPFIAATMAMGFDHFFYEIIDNKKNGEKMAVKIIVKRTVPKEKETDLLPLLLELRTKAMTQPGYISGETLRGVDAPEAFLVIGTWQSAEAWKAWESSGERAEIQDKIDALLGEKTEYGIYYYG